MNKYYADIQQPGHSNMGNKEQQRACLQHAHAYTHTRVYVVCHVVLFLFIHSETGAQTETPAKFRRFFPRITNEPGLSEGIIFMCTEFEKWTEG